ncbi:MAG: stage III sporulation protein AE [Clostridiales bacterium]|nr:stage III sporulation protein AE [Clostridiales bacterium]
MKKAVSAALTLFIAVLFSLTAHAAADNEPDKKPPIDESGILKSQYDALDLGDLESSVKAAGAGEIAELDITGTTGFNEGIGQIFSVGRSQIGGIFKGAVGSAVLIIVIAILCSVAESFFEAGPAGSVPNYITLSGVLAISLVAVGDVSAFMGLGDSTLTELSSFSKVLLPTLSAAAAASGAIASSAAKYAATALFMDVLITVSSGILMPVIYAFIAACIAEAAVGGEGITGAASFLKWMATTLLTLIVLAFVVYLGVSGVVSSATDAATLRVAKTTLSTVFPVVGSIISDAASSVLAGASVLRNAIGVFGMLAVISLCLLPFMHLGAHYILYKAVSKLTATVSGSKISKLVSGIGTAFGLTMSLTGACALMLFFSLISMIKVVTPG